MDQWSTDYDHEGLINCVLVALINQADVNKASVCNDTEIYNVLWSKAVFITTTLLWWNTKFIPCRGEYPAGFTCFRWNIAKFIARQVTALTLTFFIPLCPALVSPLEITSSPKAPLEKASGQSVKLDCQFSLSSSDTGPLDIEWSLLASDNQINDQVVCDHVFYILSSLFFFGVILDISAIISYLNKIEHNLFKSSSLCLNHYIPIGHGDCV